VPKTLADGKTKFTILTTKPADPAAPTVTELAAGIDASGKILYSDFTWSAADSDTVDEKPLNTKGNAKALGASNWEGSITAFRYFDGTTGAVDTTADTLFAAIKAKGTTLWCYARETGKDADAAWAATDEIYLGGEVQTDTPHKGDGTGYIKRKVKLIFQQGYDNIVVAGP
jgi:hypothetical protein